MNVIIKGRQMHVAPAIQDYANSKLTKVLRGLDDQATDVEIELQAERNPSIERNQVVEVTVYTKGPIIRACEAATDMHAAIDTCADKLERQVRRYRGRLIDRQNNHGRPLAAEPPRPLIEEETETEPEIVKRKVLYYKPMTMDEAMLQMELLGHDFFVFTDIDSSQVNVLYRRRDGDYGVIAPSR